MSMNVVHSGTTYQIYGDALKTYNKLPLGTYEVNFHKMMGFFLTSREDLIVNEEKIYGKTPEKVEKVLRSFEATNRNFGVILSGKKGIGKSLFARQLSIRAKDYNLPLIIVSSYFNGIADFLASIDQEVIVFFDEFEKTFADSDDFKPQEEMLSLFDGVDSGKKLFVITCNEVHKLNSYLINRPGRFHYHFILKTPNPEEIKEYMEDKLDPQYHDIIKKLIGFSLNVDLTYDVLRAIAFEINNGYSFEETLMDLNISKEGDPKYDIRFVFTDGSYRIAKAQKINIYSSEMAYIYTYPETGRRNLMRFTFSPTNAVLDIETGDITIEPNLVDVYVDEDYFDLDIEKEKAQYEHLCGLHLAKVVMTKTPDTVEYKYMV